MREGLQNLIHCIGRRHFFEILSIGKGGSSPPFNSMRRKKIFLFFFLGGGGQFDFKLPF